MDCDIISELPDCLLVQILSCLPTADSVRTSVLSTRWQHLWRQVPVIDLKNRDFPCDDTTYENFMENFMSTNRKSRMQKFKIKFQGKWYGLYTLKEWIGQAVHRGIQQLDVVSVKTFRFLHMPRNIYRSNTLVSLKLVNFVVNSPKFVVALPCLKFMHLEDVLYYDERILENLISGCPVLEYLTVIRVNGRYNSRRILASLCVRSQSLKSFLLAVKNSHDASEPSGTKFSVEIDAPRLEYMSFKDNFSDKIVIKNMSSLHTVVIDTEFNIEFGGSPLVHEDVRKRDTIFGFLACVSRVKHIAISQRTLQVLYLYSKLGQIPKFVNVCSMQVVFSCSVLQFLQLFLESFPNLKNLNLEFAVSEEPEEETELSCVPRCLSLTLESVLITEMVMMEENGIKLVKYFAQNSAVLKKLKVSFKDSPLTKEEIDTYKGLLTSTRRSRGCEVFVN